MSGNLYLVSTPIGNYADLSIRAYNTIRECNILVCEDFKEASRFLRYFDFKKELMLLNEHNEDTETMNIFNLIFGDNVQVCLISDCGTPVFADPGKKLISLCIDSGIKVDFISGANSVLTALVASGFDNSRFYYAGFLSQKTPIRQTELKYLSKLGKTVALLEAPYRLEKLLNEVNDAMPEKEIFLGINLTTNGEMHFRGTAGEVIKSIKEFSPEGKFKAEFVLILSNK